MLRRFFVFFTLDGVILSAIVNLIGACAITVVRIPIWSSFWTEFERRQLYGFIPLGLWAGATGGPVTAVVFTMLKHRPAAPWLRHSVHALATFLAALGLGYVFGAPSGYLLGEAIKSACMALVGSVVAGRLRWSLAALDPCNLQVSIVCSGGLQHLHVSASTVFGLQVSMIVASVRCCVWISLLCGP